MEPVSPLARFLLASEAAAIQGVRAAIIRVNGCRGKRDELGVGLGEGGFDGCAPCSARSLVASSHPTVLQLKGGVRVQPTRRMEPHPTCFRFRQRVHGPEGDTVSYVWGRAPAGKRLDEAVHPSPLDLDPGKGDSGSNRAPTQS